MPISFINITKALSGVSKKIWSSCKYWLKVLVPSQHRARIMNIERLLKSDNTVKRTGDVGDGILLAPKQGKKNLAKFLGIDMSALQAEAGEQTLQTGQTGITTNTQAGPQLGTAAGSQGM